VHSWANRFLNRWVCVVVLLWGATSQADVVNFATPGGAFQVSVESMETLKFTRTVRQGFDFSCGSAALATLLTYHYDRPYSEGEVFQSMWEAGNSSKIRKEGFSMLDMKRFLGSRGLMADGFKIDASKIGAVGVAGIVLLDKSTSPHFVVVVGEEEGEILLSDPARGVWNMPIEEFEGLWNGVFFVIRQEASLAKANFNDPATWKRGRWAPIGDERLADLIAPRLIDLPLWAEFNAN